MELHGIIKNDILEKLYSFCAYQERCRKDVIIKLEKLEIPPNYHEEYLTHLEEEKFLNEVRFAHHFVQGKFKSNQWGKRKIEFSMKQKELPSALIEEALNLIDDEQYTAMAIQIAEKKLHNIKDKDHWKRKQKVYAFLAQKGFEPPVISIALEEVLGK